MAIALGVGLCLVISCQAVSGVDDLRVPDCDQPNANAQPKWTECKQFAELSDFVRTCDDFCQLHGGCCTSSCQTANGPVFLVTSMDVGSCDNGISPAYTWSGPCSESLRDSTRSDHSVFFKCCCVQ